ncbi:unnamed protein product [Mytilus edulis]|uniref:Uncharacterized protein n=1 Tax=Mytilus edulis TaxID=6550 RepID=A0A8S3R5K3_MYTED|nr:unnamed protein product [Mytilus edulis]
MYMYTVYIFFIFIQIDITFGQTDPCESYSTLDNVKRSAGYNTDLTNDITISDDRLDPGWYRIVSVAGEEMPTTAPATFRCGSWYPIWLNGTEVKCPDGEYSETGYSPGCSADVPPETFVSVVQSELAEGAILNANLGPSLEPVFKCSFTDVSGQSYVYDVYWFINDQSVVTHRRLEFSNIGQALLRPNDWVGNYQMNMVVKCAVRARLNANSVPGPYFYSGLFEAGVKSESYNYQITEGQEIAIPFISSVPVGCIGSSEVIKRQCTHTLKVSQPEYQNSPEETCTTNIEPQSLAFETQDCGITLSTTSWNNPVYLNVTGYVDNVYNSFDRTGNIRIKTETNSVTDLSGVWNTVNIPDIQVVVSDHDSAMTSRTCSTWNDPRYKTSDGLSFSYHGWESIFCTNTKSIRIGVTPNSDEELFSSLPSFSSEDLYLKEYCICASEAGHTDDINDFTSVHCNLTSPMIQCKNTPTTIADSLYQECHQDDQSRRKRDTSNLEGKIVKRSALDDDDIVEEMSLTYDSNYDPDYLPPDPVWRNGWSEALARQECTNGLSKMPALALCQMYGHLVLSDYIESCVEDEGRNETLFNSTSGDGTSILQMIQNQLCPANCSNHGYCNRTECVCNNSYIGSDCSTSISEAPRESLCPTMGYVEQSQDPAKRPISMEYFIYPLFIVNFNISL